MKKVMIVDDNTLSAEGIVRNIDWELLDAEVVHVENNGDSAIESMRRVPVDLIISDIEMPNLDGISMSSLALSVNPLVKIILI
ncbi:MAG: response regulator, partial [Blautia coccoides]